MTIGLFLRLSEAVLALNLDMVEAMFERKARDLGALCLGGAVCYDSELDPAFLQPVERLVRARKHAQLGLMNLLEPIGDRMTQFDRRRGDTGGGSQRAKRIFDD